MKPVILNDGFIFYPGGTAVEGGAIGSQHDISNEQKIIIIWVTTDAIIMPLSVVKSGYVSYPNFLALFSVTLLRISTAG